MIQYVSVSTDVVKLMKASLFQMVWYHDVHKTVSKYLGASIMLI